MCCEIHDKIPNEILEKLPSAFLEMWVGWNSLRSAKKNPEKKCLGKIYVKFSQEKKSQVDIESINRGIPPLIPEKTFGCIPRNYLEHFSLSKEISMKIHVKIIGEITGQTWEN